MAGLETRTQSSLRCWSVLILLTSVLFVLSGMSQYTVTMKQRPPYLFFPVRHSTPSLWNNVRHICSFRYVTVHRHYETTSAVFVLSGTSQYTVTMKQRPPYLFFPVRHSTPSLWNSVRRFCSFGTSQYTVTMKQRRPYLLILECHTTPSLWNNVGRICWFRYVIVHRLFETTSVVFAVLVCMSQYTVTMKQRPPYLLILECHSTPSLWNNVRRICWFRYVTVHRLYETTSVVCVDSITSQYIVSMKQRPSYLFFPVRHSTRHYETTSAVFVDFGMSQYTVSLKHRPSYMLILLRHSTSSLWNNVRRTCWFWNVTVQRHYEITSAVFVDFGMSQYTVSLK